ncbi:MULTISPECIES: hypothetical protein [Ramlibacter]|uniref:DUF4124 domain-containing protein n=1 Tax=Ramlibacter pinisoli TaxID=2682844 RepID=A0A6N8IRR0_9BURK|nr:MULTISPECIES: hypothetical protein [Ramlibacter]MBA2963944.1 hypothetical protein [Ramlibacter sp. CGMCC 1.13660]MVQ28910.1 hypothetical protein [Ramlibacter pinisoli]
MNPALTLSLVALFAAALPAHAQSRIWRCGNTYTNDAHHAQAQGCKLVEGGNVTVVEGTRVNGNANAVRVATAVPAAGSNRLDSAEQKARDSDARQILEAELKKAQSRQAELQKEYNNGEPEKQGPEARNYQKYLDRVAELKASLARNESDIAGIQRELGRLPAAK